MALGGGGGVGGGGVGWGGGGVGGGGAGGRCGGGGAGGVGGGGGGWGGVVVVGESGRADGADRWPCCWGEGGSAVVGGGQRGRWWRWEGESVKAGGGVWTASAAEAALPEGRTTGTGTVWGRDGSPGDAGWWRRGEWGEVPLAWPAWGTSRFPGGS